MKKISLLKNVGYGLLAVSCALIFLGLLGYSFGLPQKDIMWGLNFSSVRAKDLGFQPLPLFRTILTDLKPEVIRLPAYWEELEPNQNQFDFSLVDSLLSETDKRGTKVILAVGGKLPRWPECHHPKWYEQLTPEQKDQTLLNMIKQTVTHLKQHPSIGAWQIENEQFFEYGPDCPMVSSKLYKQEIAAIRELDQRPLVGTDSGEKGPWINTAWTGVDIMGATMYREVYLDKKGHYQTYPLPAWTYNIKAGLVRLFSGANKTIGVELQAEPWFISDAQHTSLEEQRQHMNPEIFQQNVEYATKTGFSENYFWGAEWWYWMKQQGDDSMVKAAKQLFNK